LQKIETLLDEAGSSKEQMLRVTIWLADMDDFKGLNEVWEMLHFMCLHDDWCATK